jgi:hypothetical protein
MGAFAASTITDQKRLVRGEQLLYARTRLRVRDGLHHAKWRILIMAGMAPHGEIRAIRELMPKAHIIAVDRDHECVEAAIDAGADDVVQCDLGDLYFEPVTPQSTWGPTKLKHPNRQLWEQARFDIVSLDLCGGVTDELVGIASTYRQIITPAGILIVTFSYGRDVVEVFRDWAARGGVPAKLSASGLSPDVCSRIAYLFPGGAIEKNLHSVMVYRGHEMPMCSALLQTGSSVRNIPSAISVVRVERGDFEIAIAHPDPALIYDCPRERIEALRRSHAAIRASYTRRNAATAEEE